MSTIKGTDGKFIASPLAKPAVYRKSAYQLRAEAEARATRAYVRGKLTREQFDRRLSNLNSTKDTTMTKLEMIELYNEHREQRGERTMPLDTKLSREQIKRRLAKIEHEALDYCDLPRGIAQRDFDK